MRMLRVWGRPPRGEKTKMSHDLEINAQGNASMAYTGEAPWHQLGTFVADTAGMLGAEFMKHAGMDWEVGTEPLFAAVLDAEGKPTSYVEVKDAKGVRRLSDGSYLGTVGGSYSPLQNVQAFEWFDPFVKEGLATFNSAGSLKGGARVWALAKVSGDPLVIVPKANDIVEKYILLANAHDGTLATRAGLTPIRVVCQNTLSSALGQSSRSLFKLNHTKNQGERLDIVRDIMKAVNMEYDKLGEAFRFLAGTKMDDKAVKDYINGVFRQQKSAMQQAIEAKKGKGKGKRSKAPSVPPVAATPAPSVDALLAMADLPAGLTPGQVMEAAEEGAYGAIDRIYNEVVQYVQNGVGNSHEAVRGTAWAAYQGCSEYLTHHRGANRKDASTDRRLDSVWFGQSATLNALALQKALDFGKYGC